MHLKVTLVEPGRPPRERDVAITVDTTTTMSALAVALARRSGSKTLASLAETSADALTLQIKGSHSSWTASSIATVMESGLRSGFSVSIVAAEPTSATSGQPLTAAATLVVVSGPDAGRQVPLQRGVTKVGRGPDNDVRLTDPLVSGTHARVMVGDVIEIVDLKSANGLLIRGERVERAVLGPEDLVTLGASGLRVIDHSGTPSGTDDEPSEAFNRSPRVDEVFEGRTWEAPEPPKRPSIQPITAIPFLAPLVMGAILFAVTQQLSTVIFIALSPLLMIGSVFESRHSSRRQYEMELDEFHESCALIAQQVETAAAEEVAGRLQENPSTHEAVQGALGRSPLLWSMRPDRRGFLDVRLGRTILPSRSEVELPSRRDARGELWKKLDDLAKSAEFVNGVPLTLNLADVGHLGVCGTRAPALSCARSLMTQLACLHSPAELVIGAFVSPATADAWEWLKWLPHTTSVHSPLAVEQTVTGGTSALRLMAALEEVVSKRRNTGSSDVVVLPRVVLLVEDDAPIDRSRLVDLAEHGAGVGIHMVWLAPSAGRLPAACGSYVEAPATPGTRGHVADVCAGHRYGAVEIESLPAADASTVARSLASVVDAGARIDDDSDLPSAIPLLSLLAPDIADDSRVVVKRWQEGGSIPGIPGLTKEASLGAPVGIASGQDVALDLRIHGPHALVGGTTGAGKSEFLQSWIVGMSAEHSPARVTFLFVDYKGGAAFRDLVALPHHVGMVTDLSGHLVRRVLTSLLAELRKREHLLQRKRAKDLLELERRGDPDAPPSLVIVVDEFAALVKEVPEFIDGVIDIAQRGRSLGLHLILATQRPSGVIKDSLRANTNLRIALRMADVDDSQDVVGVPTAASFDPALPGRGIAKVGPSRLLLFQSGYVGGWTSQEPPAPSIRIADLRLGDVAEWPDDEADASAAAERPTGPTDLQRLVACIGRAADEAKLTKPERPWLDELKPVYELNDFSSTADSLTFGMRDDPEGQKQLPVQFDADRDGNIAVFGTGGTGKSTFLRTLGIAAGLHRGSGPWHVYGIDFGTRGLQMLDAMPHVGSVINGEDDERMQRLLRFLRTTIDERAKRYADASASTISDYRSLADQPDEPRILVLVDNIAAFRQAYEPGDRIAWFELFQGICADGRQVGIHIALSADRSAALPAALRSVVQRKLVLRLADEGDYSMLGVPNDGLHPETPAGRGFLDDDEVQIAVYGGSSSTSQQAAAVEAWTAAAAGIEQSRVAFAIGRLPEHVRLSDLPPVVAGRPVFGIADEDLGPTTFRSDTHLIITGNAESGASAALATLALSLRRTNPRRPLVFLSPVASPVPSLVNCTESATDVDDAALLAKDLVDRISGSPGSLAGIVVLVESLPEFLNTTADMAMQELFKASRQVGGLTIATGEADDFASSWPLYAALKSARHGLALQPDQLDGDSVFRTPFPRLRRVDFPPMRGLYVSGGRIARVQCALPELEEVSV